MAIMVDLNDITRYLLLTAANHASQAAHDRTSIHRKGSEEVAFVLRRCVEEMLHAYGVARNKGAVGTIDEYDFIAPHVPISVGAIDASDMTYRNRATA